MKRMLWMCMVLTVLLSSCAGPQMTVAEQWQEQYDLGVRYLEEGNYEEAIIAFSAAIEIDPKRAEAYVGRGDAYVLSGETEENLAAAQADYEKAVILGVEDIEVYIKLAEIYVDQGDLEKAKEFLQTGIDTIGDHGLLQTYLDDISDARRELEGYPKTERHDGLNGQYSVMEYNEYGELVNEYWYNGDESMSSETHYEYEETGKLLTRTLHTYGNDDVIRVERYDERGRLSSCSSTWWNEERNRGHQEEHSYTYQNSNTVQIQLQLTTNEGALLSTSKGYTLQDDGNYAQVMGLSWGAEGVKIRHITEYSSDKVEVRDIRYDDEGHIESEETGN